MSGFVEEGKTLGGRLQDAREKQGISISLAAKLSGVQSKTLKNWELDRSEPRSNRRGHPCRCSGSHCILFAGWHGR